MMTFDKQLAVAELDQMVILMQHHLRRIRIEKDLDTASTFYTKLGKLSEDSRRTVKEIKTCTIGSMII